MTWNILLFSYIAGLALTVIVLLQIDPQVHAVLLCPHSPRVADSRLPYSAESHTNHGRRCDAFTFSVPFSGDVGHLEILLYCLLVE